MFFLVLQSSRWDEERWLLSFVLFLFVFLVPRDCCVALSHFLPYLQFVIVVFSDQTHYFGANLEFVLLDNLKNKTS